MQSATLFYLASSVGVLFGWQPMPDGSPSYEYVVQLEPELVATLKQGQSIPISSEVPNDIRPIGRIRIVVGNDPLPRQKLTTYLKPLSESSAKKSLDGVIKTQYTVPPVESTGAGRYPAQPQANQPILPFNDTPNTNSQGFLRTLQNDTPPLNNPTARTNEILPDTGSQLRNTSAEILPDSSQLFGSSDPANPISQPAQNNYNLQTNPNRNNNLVITSQNTHTPQASNTQILPPDDSTQQQQAIADTRAASQPPLDQFFNTTPSQFDWRSRQTTTANNFNTGLPRTPQDLPAKTDFQAPPYTNTNQSLSFNSNDRYAANPNPTDHTSQPSDKQSPLAGNTPDWPTTPVTDNTASNTSPQSKIPEIRKGMLKGQASAEFQTASRQTPSTQQSTATNHVSGRIATDNGWDLPNTEQQTPPADNPIDSTDPFLLVLSWVLLSGSGIGNVYLLWNYFDVRHKYRGLVHNSRDSSRSYASRD